MPSLNCLVSFQPVLGYGVGARMFWVELFVSRDFVSKHFGSRDILFEVCHVIYAINKLLTQHFSPVSISSV